TAQVGRAAVVGPAVVKAHMTLGNHHRDGTYLGIVVSGVVGQHLIEFAAVPLGEMPNRTVVVADLVPAMAAVHHGDGAHLGAAVVERDERGQHPLGAGR